MPSPAARSGRSRRSCAATSSTPSTRAAGCITRCPTGRRASASTTIRRWRSPARGGTGCGCCTSTSTSTTATGSRRSTGRDPGVLTLSFHESGRYLFPGTGGVGELGEGTAAGTSVNVPLEPDTGEAAWLAAVRALLPELAAAFGPDLIVSPARRRLARLGSARAPARDDDRDGRGGPARRPRRAPVRGRPLAGDRRRRLRRVPGRAADVEPRLAGRRAPRGPGRDARRRGASAGRPRAPATARRRSPRRSTTPRTPGSRWIASQAGGRGPLARDRGARPARWSCPRLLQVARDRGWWDPLGRRRRRPDRLPILDLAGTPTIAGVHRRRHLGAADARGARRGAVGCRRPGTPWSLPRSVTAPVSPRRSMDRSSSASRSPDPSTAADAREVLAVGVAPAYRRRGLGSMLLGSVVDAAGAGGPPRRRHAGRTRPGRAARSRRRAAIARRLFERDGVRDPSPPRSRSMPPIDRRSGRPARGASVPRPSARSQRTSLDADQVARGIAEGAVANAVGLVGRFLDDLGALAWTRSKTPSRSGVASRIQP